jgi:hypothetical protein
VTAIVEAIVVTIVETVVVAAEMTVPHVVPMTEFAMARRLMKAAIAMIEARRLGSGHRQAQRSQQCNSKQFFCEHLSLLGKWWGNMPSPDDS